MFAHPGKKLMTAAKIIFWLGAAASALYSAFVVLVNVAGVAWFESSGVSVPASVSTASAIASAALTLVFGLFAAWVTALILYGFGKLIENSESVAASVRPMRPPIEAPQLRQTGK